MTLFLKQDIKTAFKIAFLLVINTFDLFNSLTILHIVFI